MNRIHFTQGWTLVELMITVAIIGLLASIAVPAYNSYISTSHTGTSTFNAKNLIIQEELYVYGAGQYLEGTYDPSVGTDDLTTKLEWVPGDNQQFKYVVSAGTCAGAIKECYTVTVSRVSDPTITETIKVHW